MHKKEMHDSIPNQQAAESRFGWRLYLSVDTSVHFVQALYHVVCGKC